MTRNPVSVSSAAKPAQTVMFVTKNEWELGDRVWWYYGFGTMWIVRYTTEAPECWSIPPACVANWGTGSWLADTVLLDKAANGAFTGGNTFRKAGKAIVSWGDGHVTTQAAGNLAVGTNWNANIAEADLVITDHSKYMWELD
jgi:prepilin-type processing-associated H-X9-DG protein